MTTTATTSAVDSLEINRKLKYTSGTENNNDYMYLIREDFTAIPRSCKYCTNSPLNGGSGICNCTLGVEDAHY